MRINLVACGVLASIFWAATPTEAECADLYIAAPSNEEMSAMFHTPSQWREARQYVSGIVRADHSLGEVNDKELVFWLERMREWHLGLELEVGAIKQWSIRGDETYWKEVGHWDRAEFWADISHRLQWMGR
jgi:hypothetical protein